MISFSVTFPTAKASISRLPDQKVPIAAIIEKVDQIVDYNIRYSGAEGIPSRLRARTCRESAVNGASAQTGRQRCAAPAHPSRINNQASRLMKGWTHSTSARSGQKQRLRRNNNRNDSPRTDAIIFGAPEVHIVFRWMAPLRVRQWFLYVFILRQLCNDLFSLLLTNQLFLMFTRILV